MVRHAYKFGGWFFADSAGCSSGRFSHWWRSVGYPCSEKEGFTHPWLWRAPCFWGTYE